MLRALLFILSPGLISYVLIQAMSNLRHLAAGFFVTLPVFIFATMHLVKVENDSGFSWVAIMFYVTMGQTMAGILVRMVVIHLKMHDAALHTRIALTLGGLLSPTIFYMILSPFL